jgi:DNA-binding NtrC family response regulator
MEQADGGTLFLDEIGEMDIGLQSKLLKAIEEQSFRRVGGEEKISVDIQLIAASNRNLRAASEQGDFRLDLYHRISVFELRLPSLRERSSDIADIVTTLFGEFNARSGKQVHILPAHVLQTLQSYSWPGNVRELRNVIERSVMLATGPELPHEWLGISPEINTGSASANTRSTAAPSAISAQPVPSGTASQDQSGLTLPLDGSMTLDDMEECIIRTMLERHNYNVMAAVRALGTTRETLRYRIRKYGLEDLVTP